MERVNAFRADPDGLEKHLASADGQWKALSTLSAPKSIEEAQSTFEKADKAEAQIALDLDWLEKNKAARDAARSAKTEIAILLVGEIATFKADRYAAKPYGEGEALRKRGDASFAVGDFAEAGRLLGEAKSKFTASAREARAFHVNMALESARAYLDAKKWEDCVAECAKILGDHGVDFVVEKTDAPEVGYHDDPERTVRENALAKGAIEGAKEHGILGAFSGGISATAAGISAAVLFGWLAALIFRPKTK